jgi:alpha-beta hydrolase superfamily lysophospholipase
MGHTPGEREAGEIVKVTTPTGTAFHMLAPQGGAAPTLLLLAMAGKETLSAELYGRVGRLLHAQGWNVISLDLPCHGDDCSPGAPAQIAGWVARIAAGEDIVAAFQQRVNDVVEHLVATGVADPRRLAAAGTSRGGYLACQAAAGNPRIRAVAAFSPVTDLLALTEFAGQQDNPLTRRLALMHAVPQLADRAAWIIIGNADTRVDTDKAVALARALVAAGQSLPAGRDVTLCLQPVSGHRSCPEWHDAAATWLQQRVGAMLRAPAETAGPRTSTIGGESP